MIGLKRGLVELHDHEKGWEENSVLTIEKLKSIFGSVAADIQHVGGTSIVHIKAKPIIDIAVAVTSFDDVYSLNYGFVDGIIAGDGGKQDAYILGVDHPVMEFTGMVIAVIHRSNDVEDKWVVAPSGMKFAKDEIAEKVRFVEQFYTGYIEVLITEEGVV